MATKRAHESVDPEYFEHVGIPAFLVPVLRAETYAAPWMRQIGLDLAELRDDTASVRRLAAAFAGSPPPPPALSKLLRDLESVSSEASFPDLLARLNDWDHTPPSEAMNEYNLPLWTRIHSRFLLDGVFEEAQDMRPRRLVEFAPREPFAVERSQVAHVVDRLAERLGPTFESIGRSRLCHIAPYLDDTEVALYVHHGTTLKQRAIVSDELLDVDGVDPVLQAQQRDKATMAVRLNLSSGRLRVAARSNFDVDRVRAALGEALFNDPTVFNVASRISLRNLFSHQVLQTPPDFVSATLLEVRMAEGTRGGWNIVVRHRDILANRPVAPVDLESIRPVYAKFGLRPNGGGRARTLEVYEPNAMRASKALSDTDIETFLSLNGLMTVDGANHESR